MGQSSSRDRKLKWPFKKRTALVPGPPLVFVDDPPPPPPNNEKELAVPALQPDMVEYQPETTSETVVLNDAVLKYEATDAVWAGLKMTLDHFKVPIVQVYARPDVEEQLKGVNPYELLTLLKDKSLDWDLYLQHGVGYGGHQMFSMPEMLNSGLKALIDYAETSHSAAPDIKVKMRYVAMSVLQDKEAIGVLPMLAAHGGVCNVMKETGIRAAFTALTDAVQAETDVDDPRNRVLQILYDFRELRVEKLYHAHELSGAKGDVVNTHNVVGYRNAIAKYVGLSVIPDPDTSDNVRAVPMVPVFFERFYTMDMAIRVIQQCLNDPPRKLNYNAIVGYLKYNRPDEFADMDQEEFLYHCFDDEGLFTRGSIAWMLYKMGILAQASDEEPIAVRTLFPPLDDLQLSRSRDHVLLEASGERTVEQEALDKSRGREEMEEDLLTSADLAISHNCDIRVPEQEHEHVENL